MNRRGLLALFVGVLALILTSTVYSKYGHHNRYRSGVGLSVHFGTPYYGGYYRPYYYPYRQYHYRYRPYYPYYRYYPYRYRYGYGYNRHHHHNYRWKTAKKGYIPNRAVVYKGYHVCRTPHKGYVIEGKVKGKACHYKYRSRGYKALRFKVLTY